MTVGGHTLKEQSMANNIIVSEYEGTPVSFSEEGWFNATIIAERFGKEPKEWVRLPSTQEYLKALESKGGKIPYLKTKRGNAGGTWLHPKLGVRFAQWLDVYFAIWCDEQIHDILTGKTNHHDKKRVRHMAAASYKLMCEMLQDAREDEGKETSWFNYANEAKLVNFVICGKYEGLDRDALTIDELDLLARLEVKNTLLLAKHAERDERRDVLCDVATAFWKAKQLALPANDTIAIEAA